MFETLFKKELAALTTQTSKIDSFWAEIATAYNQPDRYYHNLNHLDHMAAELVEVRQMIHEWPVLILALAYHDIVYNAMSSSNEEKSALLAKERLSRLELNETQVAKCMHLILATKKHDENNDSDTNFFIDADLTILGAEDDLYQRYCTNIRKEYRFYPDLVYKPGRKKVLQHFVQMKSIYKTTHFREKYEQQARWNISSELEMLS